MAVDTRPVTQSHFILAVPADPIWRLSVEQYHHMTRTGILTDDDPVELLEGWLVTKMPKNPPHRLSTQLTREALARLLPTGWHVNDQEPITTDESEPEPDVTIIRGERRQYLDRHLVPHEIALVVEVSDATLQRDRTSKKRIYARAGIPVYWIMNLSEQQIEVYTVPIRDVEEADYQHRQDYYATDTIPVIVEEQEIGWLLVSELLP